MSDLQVQVFNLAPRDFKEAMQYAELIAKSDLAPKDFRHKPGNVLIAVQMGQDLGLGPMASIQNIAVINGRPSLWGDAMLAVCQSYIFIKETFDENTMTATCQVKRRTNGSEWHTVTFSQQDATVAKLWGKAGPWQNSPKRMLQMRARGFCLRDTCADILRGINSAEEQNDIIRIKEQEKAPAPPAPKKPEIVEAVEEILMPKHKYWDQIKDHFSDRPEVIEALEQKPIDSYEQLVELKKIPNFSEVMRNDP